MSDRPYDKLQSEVDPTWGRAAPPPSASPGAAAEAWRQDCERDAVGRGDEVASASPGVAHTTHFDDCGCLSARHAADLAALRARAEALEELIRDHLSDPAWGEEGRAFNAETMARLRDAARGAKP